MTKDDILQALRLTALGRAGHPLQEDLAEKLAEVFAGPRPVSEEGVKAAVVETLESAAPKRRKKAD